MLEIEELKISRTKVHRFKKDGVEFGILILGRGETLFFQIGNDALICEISARHALINPKTIKKWDNGTKINEEEKVFVLEKIIELYKKAYKDELEIFKN